MYNIKISSLIEYIKNGCFKKLIHDIEDTDQQEVNEGYEYNQIFIIDKSNNLNIQSSIIDYGTIKSLSIGDDERIEIAIQILGNSIDCLNTCTDQLKVKYKDIFSEVKDIFMSIEFIKSIKDSLDRLEDKIYESKNLDKIEYIIKSNCEYCSYKAGCLSKIINDHDIQMIPNLDYDEVVFLKKNNINTLDELEIYLNTQSDKDLQDNYLQGFLKKEIYLDYINIIKNNNSKVLLKANKYIDYSSKNTELYMVTFLGHSKTDIVYGFGIKELYKAGTNANYIILDEQPDKYDKLVEHYNKILTKLYDEIESNLIKGKNTSFYIMNSGDEKNLQKIIKLILKDKKLSSMHDMTLKISEFFGFENIYNKKNNIVNNDYYVEPFIKVREMISKYLILNSPITYVFEDTLKLLTKHTLDPKFSQNIFEFSWSLKPSLINKIWRGEKVDLEKVLNSRFYFMSKMIDSFKESIKNNRIFPEKIDYLPIKASDLECIERILIKETITQIKEYQYKFADLSIDKQIALGEVICCTNVKNNSTKSKEIYGKYYYEHEFEINNISEDIFDETSPFLIGLTAYEDSIQKSFTSSSLIKIDGLSFRTEQNPVLGKVYLNKIIDSDFYITKGCFENQTKAGKNSSVTCNTDKLLNNIKAITGTQFYRDILKDVNTNRNDKLFQSPLQINGLNINQKDVYDHFNNNTLTLLWGPPGTGKTYCIGKIINQIFEQIQSEKPQSKKPQFKVLVTGANNLCVENCLNKISELDVKNSLSVGKLKEIKSDISKQVQVIKTAKNKGYRYDTDSYTVIGSTVYQLSKLEEPIEFDIIIIDEASQLKMAEYFMIHKYIGHKTRFLIVGDHLQLPAIMKNTYLNEQDQKYPLSGSLFDYYYNSSHKSSYLKTLTECFRMNKSICQYPQKNIYAGIGFRPKNNAKIELKHGALVRDRNSIILDPDFPVVLCVAKNNINSSKNINEATLVAELSFYLRNNIVNSTPQDFWAEKLCIVSPHHSQINLIKKELEKKFKSDYPDDKYFVDTVDKLQGQESDTVIVSYGVCDTNVAYQEKEFIYSLNRLNVSITRAKKKLVVIVSEELINMDWKLIDDPLLKKDVECFREYMKYFGVGGRQKISPPDSNFDIYRVEHIE